MNVFGQKITFVGNLVKGIRKGIKDEILFSNSEIHEADFNRKMLDHCKPPSKFFSKEGYTQAIKHLKNKNYEDAIKSLDINIKADPSDVCIWIFRNVLLKCVVGCPKLLSDALPMSWY